ncbi:MAG: hypothetical protein ACYS32_16500 [Planctomycetota bacterium]|jgi:hypothetical protein
MPTLPGHTDPGNVDDGDTVDPTWGDNVRASINNNAGHLAKEFVLDVDMTEVDIYDTTTETTIYTYTLAADTLGASGNAVKVKLRGSSTNHGVTLTTTLRFYYGSTSASTDLAISGDSGTWIFEFVGTLQGRGTTGTQTMLVRNLHSSGVVSVVDETVAEDSTGSLDIKVTLQMSTVNTPIGLTCNQAITKLIQS